MLKQRQEGNVTIIAVMALVILLIAAVVGVFIWKISQQNNSTNQNSGNNTQTGGPQSLSKLSDGRDPITLTSDGMAFDTCKVISEEMLRAMFPGVKGEFTTTPATEDDNGLATHCQMDLDIDGKNWRDSRGAQVRVSSPLGSPTPAEEENFFKKKCNRDVKEYGGTSRYYGDELGTGSLACFSTEYDNLEILYKGRFYIGVYGLAGDMAGTDFGTKQWRDDVYVPIAKNILSRIQD